MCNVNYTDYAELLNFQILCWFVMVLLFSTNYTAIRISTMMNQSGKPVCEVYFLLTGDLVE